MKSKDTRRDELMLWKMHLKFDLRQHGLTDYQKLLILVNALNEYPLHNHIRADIWAGVKNMMCSVSTSCEVCTHIRWLIIGIIIGILL